MTLLLLFRHAVQAIVGGGGQAKPIIRPIPYKPRIVNIQIPVKGKIIQTGRARTTAAITHDTHIRVFSAFRNQPLIDKITKIVGVYYLVEAIVNDSEKLHELQVLLLVREFRGDKRKLAALYLLHKMHQRERLRQENEDEDEWQYTE